MDCLVLIPTYNEAQNIRAVTEAVLANGPRFGVLIIDDNSPDQTGRIADELAQEEDRVLVLHRPRKQGLGPAYVAGLSFGLARTEARYFNTMDADWSHNPADLPRLLAAAEEGADLVVGSRYCQGGGVANWGLGRRIISRAGGLYARLMLGLETRDPTGGFNLLSRHVLEAIDLSTVRSSGYGFQIEIKHRAGRAGFKTVDAPICFTERRAGQSKMSAAIALEALWLVLRLAAGRG
ncbi:MAG: polyprenol monophosphomannose synthase [Deltaproteobacteria bacterium]|nr:polyprenol monophosphomannose synthase [Deltaproteobacteria bacterium]